MRVCALLVILVRTGVSVAPVNKGCVGAVDQSESLCVRLTNVVSRGTSCPQVLVQLTVCPVRMVSLWQVSMLWARIPADTAVLDFMGSIMGEAVRALAGQLAWLGPMCARGARVTLRSLPTGGQRPHAPRSGVLRWTQRARHPRI